MSEQVFDPIEVMAHDSAEIKRLRARVAELEAEVTTLKRERDEAKESARTIFEVTGPQ